MPMHINLSEQVPGLLLYIAVYAKDINLIETPEEIKEPAKHLKSELEMNNLGKINSFLSLKLEHCADGNLVH